MSMNLSMFQLIYENYSGLTSWRVRQSVIDRVMCCCGSEETDAASTSKHSSSSQRQRRTGLHCTPSHS